MCWFDLTRFTHLRPLKLRNPTGMMQMTQRHWRKGPGCEEQVSYSDSVWSKTPTLIHSYRFLVRCLYEPRRSPGQLLNTSLTRPFTQTAQRTPRAPRARRVQRVSDRGFQLATWLNKYEEKKKTFWLRLMLLTSERDGIPRLPHLLEDRANMLGNNDWSNYKQFQI